MPAIIVPSVVYILQHPTRNRRLVFRTLANDRVRIERWVDGKLEYRRERSREQARQVWVWCRKLGYVKW